ncbi:MAG: hypothetical protein ACREIV_05360, partial [Planctomycetaceae bacterium]
HVLSRFTAYVAVDRSEVVNEGGRPVQITQPVELPEGWEAESVDSCLAFFDTAAAIEPASPPLFAAGSSRPARMGAMPPSEARKREEEDLRTACAAVCRAIGKFRTISLLKGRRRQLDALMKKLNMLIMLLETTTDAQNALPELRTLAERLRELHDSGGRNALRGETVGELLDELLKLVESITPPARDRKMFWA